MTQRQKKSGFTKNSRSNGQTKGSNSKKSSSKQHPASRGVQEDLSRRSTARKKGKPKKEPIVYSQKQAEDRLRDLFLHHGLEHVNKKTIHLCSRFYEKLMNTLPTLNMSRLITLREIGVKHFIDSLVVADTIRLKFPLMDIGTGAGFPGIPLKFLYPQERIILVEKVRQRIEFLKETRDELNLENLDVLGRTLSDDFSYPVNGIITRAIQMDMSNFLKRVQSSLEAGGQVYFMKGPNYKEELDQAREDIKELPFKFLKTVEYNLPNTAHERSIIIFEKMAPKVIEAPSSDDAAIKDQATEQKLSSEPQDQES